MRSAHSIAHSFAQKDYTPSETLSRQTLSSQTTLSSRFFRFVWLDNVSPGVYQYKPYYLELLLMFHNCLKIGVSHGSLHQTNYTGNLISAGSGFSRDRDNVFSLHNLVSHYLMVTNSQTIYQIYMKQNIQNKVL